METGQLSVLSVSLLTYQTDQQMAPWSASEEVRPKKSYFSSACEYVKLPVSLRAPKNFFFNFLGPRDTYNN
jgi:hypothetical protein